MLEVPSTSHPPVGRMPEVWYCAPTMRCRSFSEVPTPSALGIFGHGHCPMMFSSDVCVSVPGRCPAGTAAKRVHRDPGDALGRHGSQVALRQKVGLVHPADA